MLVGSKDFISEARRTRKSLGGGMRQAGILAAAGLIALREMTERLDEDHDNACLLAEGLASIPHIHLNMDQVRTNMVLFSIDDDAPISVEDLIARLKNDYRHPAGQPAQRRRFRAVTHYWIRREHVDQIVQAMRTLLS